MMAVFFRFSLFVFFLFSTTVQGLDCPDKIKVFVKLEDSSKFDASEEYLFRAMTSYAVRDYCDDVTSCPAAASTVLPDDVKIVNKTKRVSFCMSVDGVENSMVLSSINGSLDQLYGALQMSSDVLQVVGVDPILEEQADPDFPTWLIPFIVIGGLVLIAALAMLYFGYKESKSEPKSEKEALTNASDDDEDDDVSDDVESGRGGVEMRTEL